MKDDADKKAVNDCINSLFDVPDRNQAGGLLLRIQSLYPDELAETSKNKKVQIENLYLFWCR